MQRRQAKSTDPLYDLSAVTVPDRDQKDATHTASYESQRPVLGPEMGQSNAQCAAVTYPNPTPQNQIMQQVEYRVDVANQLQTDQPGQQVRTHHQQMIGQHFVESHMQKHIR